MYIIYVTKEMLIESAFYLKPIENVSTTTVCHRYSIQNASVGKVWNEGRMPFLNVKKVL